MSPEIDRSGTPILSARGLHKRYGNVTAIDGADFDLDKWDAIVAALSETANQHGLTLHVVPIGQ